jgi:hypothetical protein
LKLQGEKIMETNASTKNLTAWSAIATIVAGIIHLIIIPEHWEHAPAHGLFFLIVGVFQIVWGVAIWRTPSARVYNIGAIMAGWLIVLYVLTRLLPAPFGHGPEEVAWIDIVCKFCEALGMFTLAVLIFQGTLIHSARPLAWRAIVVIVLLSFVSGFATYGIARAAEPLFPALAGMEHHDDHQEETDQHHDEGEPTEDHDH